MWWNQRRSEHPILKVRARRQPLYIACVVVAALMLAVGAVACGAGFAFFVR